MKIILNGACGRMGAAVLKRLEEGGQGMTLAAGVDPRVDMSDSRMVKALAYYTGEADVLIDFSHHSCTAELMEYAVPRGLPCVIATTGQTPEEKEMLLRASEKIALFLSANMSIGIAVLASFARSAAALLPDADIEIVEKHHNQKLDAPSGTALLLANAIKESRPEAEFVFGRQGQRKREKQEIGIHALRLGNVIGEHEILISTCEESITLQHTAYSRSLFADGAIAAARFLAGKPAGIYNMDSIIGKKA